MHRSAFISFVFHWLCLFSWICICLSVFYHLTLYVYCNIQGITLKARLSVDRDRTQAAAALHCSCNSCVYIKTDFNKNKRWLCFFFILFPRIPSKLKYLIWPIPSNQAELIFRPSLHSPND